MIHYCRNDCGMVTLGWRTESRANRPAPIRRTSYQLNDWCGTMSYEKDALAAMGAF